MTLITITPIHWILNHFSCKKIFLLCHHKPTKKHPPALFYWHCLIRWWWSVQLKKLCALMKCWRLWDFNFKIKWPLKDCLHAFEYLPEFIKFWGLWNMVWLLHPYNNPCSDRSLCNYHDLNGWLVNIYKHGLFIYIKE